jgi:hypothetical protein
MKQQKILLDYTTYVIVATIKYGSTIIQASVLQPCKEFQSYIALHGNMSILPTLYRTYF